METHVLIYILRPGFEPALTDRGSDFWVFKVADYTIAEIDFSLFFSITTGGLDMELALLFIMKSLASVTVSSPVLTGT